MKVIYFLPLARSSAFRDTAIEGRRNGREEQYPSRSRKPPMKGLADGKNSENLANKGRKRAGRGAFLKETKIKLV